MFMFMLSLAQLCHLDWSHHFSPRSRAAAKLRTTIQRLLKPRSPRDCPACRLASTLSSVVEPAPLPVRPWREMKSRRGAPKRVNTEAFACPNRKCPLLGHHRRSHSCVFLGMASMAMPSGSRPFEVLPAASLAVLDATLPCIV